MVIVGGSCASMSSHHCTRTHNGNSMALLPAPWPGPAFVPCSVTVARGRARRGAGDCGFTVLVDEQVIPRRK